MGEVTAADVVAFVAILWRPVEVQRVWRTLVLMLMVGVVGAPAALQAATLRGLIYRE